MTVERDFNEAMKYYIYSLCEPNTRTLRYIGASTDPTRRLRQHISMSRKGRSSPLWNWLRSLDKKPSVIVLRETSESLWQDDERLFIRNAKMLGMALVNATDGGLGMLNPIPEIRAKISTSHTGVPQSLERRAAQSARLKGVPLSPAHCAALKAAHTPERCKANSESKRMAWTTLEYQAKMKARKKRGPSKKL